MRRIKRRNSPSSLIPSEYQIHSALIKWARNHSNPILREHLWHPPNGGYKLSITEALKLRSMGLKRGVPDIIIDYPISPYHGMYLELKDLVNSLTPEQAKFLETRKKIGYKTGMVRSIDMAIKFIEDYLKGV